MKRCVSLLLVLVICFSLAACKDEKQVSRGALSVKVNELAKDYASLDEMPDWTGDKLDLVVWFGYGSNEVYVGKYLKDDKFRSELERVTGVTISGESFDNGGETGDARLAKMVATDTWPHVGIGIEASIVKSLIDAEKLYPAHDMIPEYMTNYMDIVNSHDEIKRQFNRMANGHSRYTLSGFSEYAVKYYDKDYTPEKYAKYIPVQDSRNWFWIRDDILTQIHPEAKTQQEIKDIYLKNGKYTKEDLTDFTIKSPKEFKELLKDINKLNLKENGRKIWPFYTHCGTDNWDLLTQFGPRLFGKGLSGAVSCFCYYDGEEDKMKKTLEEKWFKDMVKYFTDFVNEGLASEEALIDNRAAFDQKKANGEYAILYGSSVVPPTDEQLKAAGKNYAYRKVMIDVPVDYTKYVQPNSQGACFGNYPFTFFNTSLTETQLEQVMRFIDLFYTEAGMKYANWGPDKEGLYEINDKGEMVYKEKKLEDAMINSGDNQILIDYGKISYPRIDYFMMPDGVNKYQPKVMYVSYERERDASEWSDYWNYGYVEATPNFPTVDMSWNIWNFTAECEGLRKFWNARATTEEALKTIFTAKTDAKFDSLYENMLSIVEMNGYDDQALEEMTEILKEKNGEEVYNDLKNWKYE